MEQLIPGDQPAPTLCEWCWWNDISHLIQNLPTGDLRDIAQTEERLRLWLGKHMNTRCCCGRSRASATAGPRARRLLNQPGRRRSSSADSYSSTSSGSSTQSKASQVSDSAANDVEQACRAFLSDLSTAVAMRKSVIKRRDLRQKGDKSPDLSRQLFAAIAVLQNTLTVHLHKSPYIGFVDLGLAITALAREFREQVYSVWVKALRSKETSSILMRIFRRNRRLDKATNVPQEGESPASTPAVVEEPDYAALASITSRINAELKDLLEHGAKVWDDFMKKAEMAMEDVFIDAVGRELLTDVTDVSLPPMASGSSGWAVVRDPYVRDEWYIKQ